MSRRTGAAGLLIVIVVAGCGAAPTRAPSATAASATASRSAEPSPAEPMSAAPAVSRAPSPRPTATPAPPATPAPTATRPAETPPPDDASAWSLLTWRRLAADDPLAQAVSMVHWSGGFVATGGLVTSSAGTTRTVVSTSIDGRTLIPLDPDALGPSTAVVGVAETPGGVVLLTLQTDQFLSEDASPPAAGTTSALPSWTLKGPLQSWTSSDGRAWTAHPIPQVTLVDELLGESGQHPALVGGSAGRPLLVTFGVPQAVSTDGTAWTAIHSAGFPAHRGASAVAASGVGFVAAFNGNGRVVETTSTDGRAWAVHTITTADAVTEDAIGGPGGVIVTGMTDAPPGMRWLWWSTRDGRRWQSVPGFAPLGAMRGDLAQECADSCPDGSLHGDADRFFAYRGWGEQAAWTSGDGRTWHPVALEGRPERSEGWLDDSCTHSIVLLPVGVTCHTSEDVVWFGEATR